MVLKRKKEKGCAEREKKKGKRQRKKESLNQNRDLERDKKDCLRFRYRQTDGCRGRMYSCIDKICVSE